VEPGKYFEKNHKKLDSIPDIEQLWAAALDKCRDHIKLRLKRRVTFGAHTESRLGENPIDYYLSYAYKAILSGDWEWKDSHSLSEQMVLIADSTISTEVEKMDTKKAQENLLKFTYDDPDTLFYHQDPLPDKFEMVKEILINKQISVLEEAISGDEELELFWECVKDGMKRAEIAAFMEKKPKQVDKLKERLIKKVTTSPYFEMEE
jgi:hypothetical protein